MKVKINNTFYVSLIRITVERVLNSVTSGFSFETRFDPEDENHRKAFKPLSYSTVQIFADDGTRLLTGYAVNHSFNSESLTKSITITGYCNTGILNACNIPKSKYPLERQDISISELADDILNAFNISWVQGSNLIGEIENFSLPTRQELTNVLNIPFKKVEAQPSDSVAEFFIKLAKQKNVVVSNNTYGQLVFYRPNLSKAPRWSLTKNNSLSMRLDTSTQGMHSNITVLRQFSGYTTDTTPEFSVENPLIGKFKPSVSVLTSGSETETPEAAKQRLGSELKGINLTVVLEGIVKIDTGDILLVQNNEVYLYYKTRMVVRVVRYKELPEGKTTELVLNLPQTYTGEVPKQIF